MGTGRSRNKKAGAAAGKRKKRVSDRTHSMRSYKFVGFILLTLLLLMLTGGPR